MKHAPMPNIFTIDLVDHLCSTSQRQWQHDNHILFYFVCCVLCFCLFLCFCFVCVSINFCVHTRSKRDLVPINKPIIPRAPKETSSEERYLPVTRQDTSPRTSSVYANGTPIWQLIGCTRPPTAISLRRTCAREDIEPIFLPAICVRISPNYMTYPKETLSVHTLSIHPTPA